MPSYYSDSLRGRPDRALRVECTFNRRKKAITFRSCGNCSLTKLRKKAEEAFSELRAHSWTIQYQDDDGETTDIIDDLDLTDAIQYFQAGLDDAPVSSGASILSGASGFSVDYDGRLSDTSSLAPSDEYGDRRRSMDSFSLNGSLNGGYHSGPLDDDQVTISSRDRSIAQPELTRFHAPGSVSLEGDDRSVLARDEQQALQQYNPNRDSYYTDTSSRPPSGVFERMKHYESKEQLINGFNDAAPILMNPRGVAWLQDQTRIGKEVMLGRKPTPSELDKGSIRLSMDSVPAPYTPDGDLALERDRRGKFYYSYTSSVSSHSQAPSHRIRDSIASSSALSRAPSGAGHRHSTPMQPLPPIPEPVFEHSSGSASGSEIRGTTPSAATHTVDLPPDIPPELLIFRDPLPDMPPKDAVSECSSCGTILDAIRYVCATCGPKSRAGSVNGKHAPGKGKIRDLEANGSDSGSGSSPGLYPPSQWASNMSASRSNQTLVNGHSHDHQLRLQTSMASLGLTPTLHTGTPPGQSPVTTLHSPGSVHSHSSSMPGANPEGYELCAACIESVGVVHALDAGLTSSMPSPSLTGDHGHGASPSDSHRSFSEWKRSAPRMKGQLRHAYLEQLLGPDGWQTITHDEEGKTTKCSTCNNNLLHKWYKCLSCDKIHLCKSCYSQVHEIHPSHVFLEVRNSKDQPARSESDSNGHINEPVHPAAEPSLSHGIKCAHCMLEIVGARFHCAICDNIDICFNCESAGLPGDLDSADGGHSSKHIMIKIPVPLEANKVESLSRQTVHLWTGRDAPHLGDERLRPREESGSVVSNHRTVMAPSVAPSLTRAVVDGESDNHHMICDNCEELIVGARYQCASCPSSPNSYNLCASCEPRSYIVHNPMHIFFKLPRPVHRPLQSAVPFLPPLYKVAAGPTFGNADPAHPSEYLRSLLHLSIACDLCIERIQGQWYWCVYCGKDLCDAHEAMDTHDPTHVFVVFKAPVDVQAFKRFAETEMNPGQPRVVPYPVYLV